MTLDAVIAENRAIARPDANGFVEILQSESFRVPKPILGLGQVLAEKIVRRVAIIARRDGVMTGLLPAIVFVPHDMTVDAGFRVIAKVGAAFRIVKRVTAHPKNNAQKNANHKDRGT
jgi:hypothetical protein